MRGPTWLFLAGTLLACRDNSAASIRIVAGPNPSDELTLVPRASLAEYIEVTEAKSSLLLTLTSAARTCDGGPAPDHDTISLSIQMVLPGGAKPEPGSFPILAEGQSTEQPHALATVKLHGRRQQLRPGGSVELRQVDLSPHGSLEGLLKLEFPGDAEHPATRVAGAFLAHFCLVNRLR